MSTERMHAREPPIRHASHENNGVRLASPQRLELIPRGIAPLISIIGTIEQRVVIINTKIDDIDFSFYLTKFINFT